MAQTWQKVLPDGDTHVLNDNVESRLNEETLRSNFEGESPPSDPVYGQTWIRKSTATKYTYTETGTDYAGGWTESIKLGDTGRDLILARGSTPSLSSRLGVTLNNDGSLKQGRFSGGTCGDATFGAGEPLVDYFTGGKAGQALGAITYVDTSMGNIPNGYVKFDSNGRFQILHDPVADLDVPGKKYMNDAIATAVANISLPSNVEVTTNKNIAGGYAGVGADGKIPLNLFSTSITATDKYDYLTFEGNTTSTTAWWNGDQGVIVDRTVYIPNDLIGRLFLMQVSIKAPSSWANGAWLPVLYPIIQPLPDAGYYRMGGNYMGAQGFGTGLFYRITLMLLKNE